MPNTEGILKRGKPFTLFITTVIALLVASAPLSVPAFSQWHHDSKINSTQYKQEFGFWETLDLPEEFKINSIHGAVLPSGKVLLVAGSGNDRTNFNTFNDSGKIEVLKTALYDPSTQKVKLIDTPSDLFCSGHTMLQGGNLLIAGGTSGYELLEGSVKKPAGAMILHNENPDSPVKTFKKGTKFISPAGKTYVSTETVKLDPAHKTDRGNGDVEIHASATKVFVEAVAEDASYLTYQQQQFKIEGLKGSDVQNIYGLGSPMTLQKQDFRGDDKSYEFDPVSEKYITVGDLKESRWYASLPLLTNGDVLAVSGLDNTGVITETTEFYDPNTKTWRWGPDQGFPTYPALFRTSNPAILFYSGSSAGYGPADKNREPGYWNITTDTFTPVKGLREMDKLETSASVMLPPPKGSNNGEQSWRVMVAGGGGVGESDLVTSRTDTIDLATPNPSYTPGPNLPKALRYINMTVTPWDEVFASGGTADYRSKGNSYSYQSFMIDPAKNKITPMADELIGRGYHSGSLLLRDGRILVFGNDPLFSDKDNSKNGSFEKRIEIFTPPQYFRSKPAKLSGPSSLQAQRGQILQFDSSKAGTIKTARLIPPSSTTHVTNVEQRSVGVKVTASGNSLSFALPTDENLLPNGWYMLFAVNDQGVPSTAKMIQVVK